MLVSHLINYSLSILLDIIDFGRYSSCVRCFWSLIWWCLGFLIGVWLWLLINNCLQMLFFDVMILSYVLLNLLLLIDLSYWHSTLLCQSREHNSRHPTRLHHSRHLRHTRHSRHSGWCSSHRCPCDSLWRYSISLLRLNVILDCLRISKFIVFLRSGTSFHPHHLLVWIQSNNLALVLIHKHLSISRLVYLLWVVL